MQQTAHEGIFHREKYSFRSEYKIYLSTQHLSPYGADSSKGGEILTEYSILIGGKAGDGITQAGQLIGSLFSTIGYYVYLYSDYPSLIRGGHNFCIIRVSDRPVFASRADIDIILALDQKSVDLHKKRLKKDGALIYDSGRVKTDGQALPIRSILDEYGGRPIMGNSAMIGALGGYYGIPWDSLEKTFRKRIPKDVDTNLKIARRAYDQITAGSETPKIGDDEKPLLSGNEYVALGLLAGGIDAYVAYPMTPASTILHFLAGVANEAGIEVIHPESEIAVILMALGFAYTGKRTAVGTSGGGFCLMTEGLSFAGMAEIPIVIILAQRTGPSTGLPTYSAQSDLLFACHAGQGEFPRYIAAPGTPEEAIAFAAEAVDIAWRYQVPAFILTDKTFSEGYYTLPKTPEVPDPKPLPSPSFPYHRYEERTDGISPLLFPPYPGEMIKVNSYTHDSSGISIEDPETTIAGTEKRLRKAETLALYTDTERAVITYGRDTEETALLCWGSNRGVCMEVADELGIRCISPIILSPFPKTTFRKAVYGIKKMILVEDSATGQLSQLIAREGYLVSDMILRYDGRPFTVDELLLRVRGCL